MTLITNVAFLLWCFGLSRLVAINVEPICHSASEYYGLLQLAVWTTWLGVAVVGALCTWQHEYILLLIHYEKDRIIQWILSYIFYWMLLLLLSVVNNTTIILMASLNTIDGKNRWLSYTATLLSLLLAIEHRPTRLVVIAWHHQGHLVSRTTKQLDGTVTLLASSSLARSGAYSK